MRLRGITMAAALAAIAGAPALAAEDIGAGGRYSLANRQLAQGGPPQVLTCRGGGDARFDFYANKNNTRELCVFFRWVREPLRESKPPAGYCGFANRAPELKERRVRLFCQSIARTFQIRRWPPGSRQRFQFLSADAPYLAKLGDPGYTYRLEVSNQGTSFNVGAVLDLPKKKPKPHPSKHESKTQ